MECTRGERMIFGLSLDTPLIRTSLCILIVGSSTVRCHPGSDSPRWYGNVPFTQPECFALVFIFSLLGSSTGFQLVCILRYRIIIQPCDRTTDNDTRQWILVDTERAQVESSLLTEIRVRLQVRPVYLVHGRQSKKRIYQASTKTHTLPHQQFRFLPSTTVVPVVAVYVCCSCLDGLL